MPFATARDGAQLYYEVHGQGPAVFIGPSPGAMITSPRLLPRALGPQPYIEALSGAYRVIVMDQMRGSGRSEARFAAQYTPDVAASDLLAVADAAGAERFAWFGFSWGAVLGLQLAIRSPRVSALVCGGWPPLDAPHEGVLALAQRMTRAPLGWIPAVRRSGNTLAQYYGELCRWNAQDQRRQLGALQCPRLLFIGDQDNGGRVQLAERVRATQQELLDLGWDIHWIPGATHQVIARPQQIVPLLKTRLDELRGAGLL